MALLNIYIKRDSGQVIEESFPFSEKSSTGIRLLDIILSSKLSEAEKLRLTKDQYAKGYDAGLKAAKNLIEQKIREQNETPL